jgi:hypothetical protein
VLVILFLLFLFNRTPISDTNKKCHVGISYWCNAVQVVLWKFLKLCGALIQGTRGTSGFIIVKTWYRTLFCATSMQFTSNCFHNLHFIILPYMASWLPLWSSGLVSGQSSWLQIQMSQVWFLVLPDFLKSSGSGTGPTEPREHNWRATWMK